MEEFYQQINAAIGPDVWHIVKALGILVLGWIVALIVAAVVRGALRRTDIDNQIAAWFAGEERLAKIDLEAAVGKIAFYLVMLFVLVAAFDSLGLPAVTEPLNALLEQVMAFAPRVLSAALLLGLAWLLATGVKFVVSKAVSASKLGEHVLEEAGQDESKGKSLGDTIGEALYWFVFLLFLPGVLDALALEGMMAPVQGMMSKVTAFLPNIFTAGVTLAVGWLLARIVQRIVSSFAAAVGADAFVERVGLQSALGGQPASKVLGGIVYVLVFIPILISALSALRLDAVTAPLSNMLTMILEAIPAVFAALVVLAVSFAVGKVVAGLVTSLLTSIGFDRILEKLGLGKASQEESKRPAAIVGSVVLTFIMLFAATEAASLLGFSSLEGLIGEFLVTAGHILFGVVIFGLGLFLANFAADAVAATGAPNSSALAMLTRVAILVLSGAIALRQMGIANEIISLAFGLILGAVAVAAAIAFGVGGRELAARQLERWSSRLS